MEELTYTELELMIKQDWEYINIDRYYYDNNKFELCGLPLSLNIIKKICKLLENNKTCKELNLISCDINDEYMIEICNMLKKNSCLKEIDLRYNNYTCDSWIYINDMLNTNLTITIFKVNNEHRYLYWDVEDKIKENIKFKKSFLKEKIYLKIYFDKAISNKYICEEFNNFIDKVNPKKIEKNTYCQII